MGTFVLHLKKCTGLNGVHLEAEQMLRSTQEQTDRHHAFALYLEYNKVVVSEFSFNLNGYLEMTRIGSWGPFFGRPCMSECPPTLN